MGITTGRRRTGDDEESCWITVQKQRVPHRRLPTSMYGRCFRCLGNGHFAREFRDPVVCRLCLRPGHRQKGCTHYGGWKRHEVDNRSEIMEKMAGCLVGEVMAGTSTVATIIQNLPTNEASQGQPECFQLDSGEFLLRRLPKPIYWELLGTTQIIKEEVQIHWRRPMATDGALMARKETNCGSVMSQVLGSP